jgi:hypothetical protein
MRLSIDPGEGSADRFRSSSERILGGSRPPTSVGQGSNIIESLERDNIPFELESGSGVTLTVFNRETFTRVCKSAANALEEPEIQFELPPAQTLEAPLVDECSVCMENMLAAKKSKVSNHAVTRSI